MLDRLGGFDSDFFLVYEDADLNMRACLMGYRCLYVPEAVVYHRVNFSIGTFSRTYVYYGHRNSEAVFWKNMPGPLLLRYLPERLLFNTISWVYFVFKGRGWTFLRAKFDFLTMLPSLSSKRRRIQREKVLSARQLRQKLDRNWLRYRRKKPRP
jgi:GT2 family glycosyltransferase